VRVNVIIADFYGHLTCRTIVFTGKDVQVNGDVSCSSTMYSLCEITNTTLCQPTSYNTGNILTSSTFKFFNFIISRNSLLQIMKTNKRQFTSAFLIVKNINLFKPLHYFYKKDAAPCCICFTLSVTDKYNNKGNSRCLNKVVFFNSTKDY
jgi:uncharacterized membrane protein